MPPLMTTTTTLIEHNHCSHKDTKDNNSTRKTCPLSHLYAGEGGQVVGLVTLGDGTSKQEEKSSNVDPERYFSQLFFLILYLLCYLWSSDPPLAGARLQRDWLRSPPSVRWERWGKVISRIMKPWWEWKFWDGDTLVRMTSLRWGHYDGNDIFEMTTITWRGSL